MYISFDDLSEHDARVLWKIMLSMAGGIVLALLVGDEISAICRRQITPTQH